MTQNIPKGCKQLVAEARQRINELSVEEVERLHEDEGVVIVDVRDVRELKREGKIPGAFHCPRGLLEFWIDPQSPYFKDIFAHDKHFVFYCAAGQRSALAADVVQIMGLKPVSHMIGGFKAWVEAKGAIEKLEAHDE